MNCTDDDMTALDCFIVPWISYCDYVISGHKTTLLYEQKSHVYYLLSGNAFQAWKNITENTFDFSNDIPHLQLLVNDNIIICHQKSSITVTEKTSKEIEKYKDIPSSLHKAIKAEGYVFDVHWDITNKCNEKCIHCYNNNAHNGLRNASTNELSFDEAKLLVDELCYLGVFRLVLSGGEVLTKPFFISLCRYIRQKHIQLIVYTNGLAFTKEMLHDLATLYPSNVCFSVYGHTNSIHDNITQVQGSYDKVLFALSYLKNFGIETSHKNTALTTNYEYWQETLLKGKQIANVSLVNCTIYPSLDGNGLTPYRLNEYQLIEMAKSTNSPIYYKKKIRGACNVFKPKNETPCYSNTNTVYINPQGEICLCIALPCVIASLRDGNIRKLKRNHHLPVFINDFSKLKSYERLDNWRSLKITDLTECGHYDYCAFCIDICPGDAYILTGNLLCAPENHCIIAKARYKASLECNQD